VIANSLRVVALLALGLLAGACGARSALPLAAEPRDSTAGDGARDRPALRDQVPTPGDLAHHPGDHACPGDRDCDGDPDSTDCAPDEASIHHGQAERCNGKDDDCDGQVDESGAIDCTKYYSDQDGDGYGASAACLCQPEGAYQATKGGDCYEGGAGAKDVHPGQTAYFSEPRGDGSYDYDCDGAASPETAVGGSTESKAGWITICGVVQGFKMWAPPCGSSGEYVTMCYYSGPVDSCIPATILSKQRCH